VRNVLAQGKWSDGRRRSATLG